MPSEEALRAATVINSVLSASAGRWPTEARIAEIIDRKFATLREAYIAIIEDRTLAYAKLAEAEEERDELRKALDNLRAEELGL